MAAPQRCYFRRETLGPRWRRLLGVWGYRERQRDPDFHRCSACWKTFLLATPMRDWGTWQGYPLCQAGQEEEIR